MFDRDYRGIHDDIAGRSFVLHPVVVEQSIDAILTKELSARVRVSIDRFDFVVIEM